jgi:hypothetical protein
MGWASRKIGEAGRDDRNSMRDGIAAAFVVTYLVIVGWKAFIKSYNDQSYQLQLTRDLVGNFTVLVGVVVGGYFGTDAVNRSP